MGEYHQRIRLPLPLVLLGCIEAGLFLGMPYLATFILNHDRFDLATPEFQQAVIFTLPLLALMVLFGLYDSRRGARLQGDLARTAWIFSLTGALLILLADYSPLPTLSFSVTILALLIGFFVQRTTRLVYFDAVALPETSIRSREHGLAHDGR